MRLGKLIRYILFYTLTVVWLIPLIGVIVISFRPVGEIAYGWWNFKKFTFTLDNFVNAWNWPGSPAGRCIINTFIVSVPSTIIPIFITALSGYAFARFNFPFKKILNRVLYLFLGMPLMIWAVPLYFQMLELKLVDTFLGAILVHTTFAIPAFTLLMNNYFVNIPREYEESAVVDGANYFQIFWYIILPVSRPAILSLGTLQFVMVWNSFLVPLLFLNSPSKWTIIQAVARMSGQYFADWGAIAAASIYSMIVPLFLYFLFQKYMIQAFISGLKM